MNTNKLSCIKCKKVYEEQLKVLSKQIKLLKELIYCPKCKSHQVCYVKGGTCLKPIPNMNWICENCLYEW